MSIKNIIDTIINFSNKLLELSNEGPHGNLPEYESIDILLFKTKVFKPKIYSDKIYSEIINKIELIPGVYSVEKVKVPYLGIVIEVKLLSYYKKYLSDYQKMIEYSGEVEKIYEYLEGKVSKEFIAGRLINEKNN